MRNPKREIDKGNLVLFPFEENSITTTYKLGLVCDLEKGSDNIPRIIEVAYVNHSETNLPTDPNDREHLGRLCSFKRFTRKGIHTLCKIYAIELSFQKLEMSVILNIHYTSCILCLQD